MFPKNLRCCSTVSIWSDFGFIFSKKSIRRALKQNQGIERQSNTLPLQEHDNFSVEGIYYSCSQKTNVWLAALNIYIYKHHYYKISQSPGIKDIFQLLVFLTYTRKTSSIFTFFCLGLGTCMSPFFVILVVLITSCKDKHMWRGWGLSQWQDIIRG